MRDETYHLKYYANNAERLRKLRMDRYNKNKTQDGIWRKNGLNRLRNLVLAHYGITCAHCGEQDIDVLMLAWAGVGPDPCRSASGGSAKRFRNIRDAKYPNGYQTRCQNCNTRIIKQDRAQQIEKDKSEKEILDHLDRFSRTVSSV